MWDHVTLRATDLEASAAFYDTVLRTLGHDRSHAPTGSSSGTSSPSRPPTPRSRRPGGCTSASRPRRASTSTRSGRPASTPATATTATRPAARVRPGLLRRLPARPRRQQRGGGPPRPRRRPRPDRPPVDPRRRRRGGQGVLRDDRAVHGRAAQQRAGGPGALRGPGLVLRRRGPPTENLHMAFPAADQAAVQAFHRTAVDAGYRDNGGRASGRSTTRATTARSCSTRTATTSRPSSTTARAIAGSS